METVLGIFCKQPIPGKVKTRLAKDIGDEAAARLYEAFLTDIVERMRETADRRILCYTPNNADAAAYFTELSRGDFDLVTQSDGDLGDRLEAFFSEQFKEGHRKVIVIGSDSPTIRAGRIRVCFSKLGRGVGMVDAILGKSCDGGYYLIGLQRIADDIFDGIEWSTASVYDAQLVRLKEAEYLVGSLTSIPEVDTIDDLSRLTPEELNFCQNTQNVLRDLNLS